jgi:hypothetical protein
MREFELTEGPNKGRRVHVVSQRADDPQAFEQWPIECDCIVNLVGDPIIDPDGTAHADGLCSSGSLRPV